MLDVSMIHALLTPDAFGPPQRFEKVSVVPAHELEVPLAAVVLEEESPLAPVGHVREERRGESVGDELEVVAARQGRVVALEPLAGVDLEGTVQGL